MIKTILKIVVFVLICLSILYIVGSFDTKGYSWLSPVVMFIVFKLMFRKKKKNNDYLEKHSNIEGHKSTELGKNSNEIFYSKNKGIIIIGITGIVAALITFIYSYDKKEEFTSDEIVNKSFKELKQNDPKTELLEILDTTYNLYSNFKYGITYDGPDKWKYDLGASEHSIYTTYERDSAISFNVIVLDLKVDKTKQHSIWDIYQSQKITMDNDFRKMIGVNFNSDIKISQGTKTYIKNNVALRREIDYTLKDLEYSQENKMICYQTFRNGNNYTFALDVPLVFYQENKSYYESFFEEINWLKNQEDVDRYINESLSK